MVEYTQPRASFLEGYLVAEHSGGAPIVGAVRRTGSVWRIMQFGLSPDEQPKDVFASRESNDQNLWMALGEVTRTGAPSRG